MSTAVGPDIEVTPVILTLNQPGAIRLSRRTADILLSNAPDSGFIWARWSCGQVFKFKVSDLNARLKRLEELGSSQPHIYLAAPLDEDGDATGYAIRLLRKGVLGIHEYCGGDPQWTVSMTKLREAVADALKLPASEQPPSSRLGSVDW